MIGLCFWGNCYAQSAAEKSEQLEQKLKEEKSDSLRAWINYNLHDVWFRDDPEKSLRYVNDGLSIALKDSNNALITVGYIGLARCYRKKHYYPAMYKYDSLAYHYAVKTVNKNLLFNTTMALAQDHLDQQTYNEVMPWLLKSKEIAAQTNDPEQNGKVLNAIGFYSAAMNQNDSAYIYFEKAVEKFREAKNAYKVAETSVWIAQLLQQKNKMKEAASKFFESLSYFQKNNNVNREADVRLNLGYIYLTLGESEKGLTYYNEARELYRKSNNIVQMAIGLVDIIKLQFSAGRFSKGLPYLKEADSIFNAEKYVIGQIQSQTFYGWYYSMTGNRSAADYAFKKASDMLAVEPHAELKSENDRYWASHLYRGKKNQQGDSLIYVYAKQLVSNSERIQLAKELSMVKARNKSIDSNSLKILAVLYHPGGADLLKEKLKQVSLHDLLPFDSLDNVNPFSKGTAAQDSADASSFRQAFYEMETKYKTRQIKDSLVLAQQEGLLAKQEVSRQNIKMAGIGILMLLLCVGLWLQIRNRKKTEEYNVRISMLQDHIHHLVKNNLGIVNRFIQIEEKREGKQTDLSSLKSRVNAMGTLHESLYKNDVKGLIPLQSYFEKMTNITLHIADASNNISINVKAPVYLEQDEAQKLGLIVNELVTNSVKYAFPGGKNGSISITAEQKQAGLIRVEVADNGVPNPGAKTGYGSRLIAGYTNDLKGKGQFFYENGTRYILDFKPISKN